MKKYTIKTLEFPKNYKGEGWEYFDEYCSNNKYSCSSKLNETAGYLLERNGKIEFVVFECDGEKEVVHVN